MKPLRLALLRAYKVALSPYFGSQCRFLPTCSDYAREAIVTHGAGRGSWLAARRLCRCHPFAQGGYDPVPPCSTANAAETGRQDRSAVTHRLPRP